MRKDKGVEVVGDWEKLEENVGNQDISNTDEISELVESDVENSLLLEEKLLWSIDAQFAINILKSSTNNENINALLIVLILRMDISGQREMLSDQIFGKL